MIVLASHFYFSDEQFFKELRSSAVNDSSLWLVHLVQLKKLFLKLSSFVELFLHQDWSLLPVPDFKAVAKADVNDPSNAHLNFIVAAVLLTASHSRRNGELLRVFEGFGGPRRAQLDQIHEAVIKS